MGWAKWGELGLGHRLHFKNHDERSGQRWWLNYDPFSYVLGNTFGMRSSIQDVIVQKWIVWTAWRCIGGTQLQTSKCSSSWHSGGAKGSHPPPCHALLWHFSTTNVFNQQHTHGWRAGPADSDQLEHTNDLPSMRCWGSIKRWCYHSQASKLTLAIQTMLTLEFCSSRQWEWEHPTCCSQWFSQTL